MRLDRSATPEEVAALSAAIAASMASETQEAASELDGWRAAGRIESLGIVRRIPGKLDLCYMGPATRERMSRPQR